MNNFFGKVRQFIIDTMAELRKCTWPNRGELFESTVLVIVGVLILASFVAVVDEVSRHLINFITMQ